MKLLFLVLLVSLFICASALASSDSGLLDAEKARALLGPGRWSEVVKIENSSPSSNHSRTVYATVFELSSALWIYIDTEGTQSLSKFFGQTKQDRDDLRPLLKAIDPGFGRYEVISSDPIVPSSYDGRLENGCFVESLSLLRERVAEGSNPSQPRLLVFYSKTRFRTNGHTVLTYTDHGHVYVVDPAWGRRPMRFDASQADSPRSLAEAVSPVSITNALWLPVDWKVVWRADATQAVARNGGSGSQAPARLAPL